MYIIVWEFVVRPEKVTAFVAAYQSDGAWAKLFAQADGYIGTELLHSTDQAATFHGHHRSLADCGRLSRAFRNISAPSTGCSTYNSKV